MLIQNVGLFSRISELWLRIEKCESWKGNNEVRAEPLDLEIMRTLNGKLQLRRMEGDSIKESKKRNRKVYVMRTKKSLVMRVNKTCDIME